MKIAICLHSKDNVATLLDDVQAGESVFVKNLEGKKIIVLQVKESIPHGHKISLQEIQAKINIVKYGEIIGRSMRAIHKGTMVHVHNLESLREGGERK